MSTAAVPPAAGRRRDMSGRRRHTRASSDWSSDVCSSDLDEQARTIRALDAARRREAQIDLWVAERDRKSVVEGKSVDLGGRRIIKKEKERSRHKVDRQDRRGLHEYSSDPRSHA